MVSGMEILEARIIVAPENLGTLVGGLVVPEDQLPVGISLGQNTIQSLSQIFLAVEAVHDHTDKRLFRHVLSSSN
jgi:hypothetical protein